MALSDNLTSDRQTFVSHLECSASGEHYAADEPHGLSRRGKPLLVRYHLDAVAQALSKQELAGRGPDMWRYRELLPVRKPTNIVSLGEVMTPLLPTPRLSRRFGVSTILVKDEGRLPTGSFKSRGISVAVSMAKEFGLGPLAIPTAGNAGSALAAYASRAGLESYVFCPEDALQTTIRETALQVAKVYCANGLINDCGRVVAEGRETIGWFDFSTMKEPYRLEGKKTMGLELAEQLDWQLPDVIFYPTGGGTGLIGMWKAFTELAEMGWIGTKRPRMVAVQATGCAPIVKAFDEGADFAEPWPDPKTRIHGIRIPVAVGDFLILQALRESGGFALAVSDEAADRAQAEMARTEGILLCPEGAATLAAYEQSLESGHIAASDRAVLFNCGNALKSPLPTAGIPLDISGPIDYGKF